jgi:hypothetical protein
MEKIFATPPLTAQDLADLLETKPYRIVAELIKASMFLAPRDAIPPDKAVEIARQFGFELHFVHPN